MGVIAKNLISSKYAATAATTEYTAAISTRVIIDKFTVTNTDGASQTVTVYLVPSGGTAGGSNTIVSAQILTTNETRDFSSLQNQILNSGDFISVFGSVSSKLVIRASGREVI